MLRCDYCPNTLELRSPEPHRYGWRHITPYPGGPEWQRRMRFICPSCIDIAEAHA
jgi:hypothetical protein